MGEPAPQDFIATRSTSQIPDPVKTEEARVLAENNVEAPYEVDGLISQGVINDINLLFTDLTDGAFLPVPDPELTNVPDIVGRAIADAEVLVQDAGLEPVVAATVSTNDENMDGVVAAQIPLPNFEVEVGTTVNLSVFRFGASSTSIPPSTTTTLPPIIDLPRRAISEQVDRLAVNHAILPRQILEDFVDLFDGDLDRVADGESSVFPDMQETAIGWAEVELTNGIRQTEFDTVRNKYLFPATRPPMSIVGIPASDVETTHNALANLVAYRLSVNEVVDAVQYELNKSAARLAVPEQTTSFAIGDPIALEGDILTSVQVAAITELGLYEPDVVLVAPGWALAFFGAISILVFAFLMYRINSRHIQRTRDIVLLAIIMCLAAIAAKVPDLVTSPDNHAIGYIIPAVAIGVMASILFDQRTALLMAMPMAGFAAIATTDIPFTVYAGVAAAIPVAFVSALSSRSQLRLSVIGSAVVVAPVAAGLEFLFEYGVEGSSPLLAAFWAFTGAVVFGFLGQGLVSFLETAFGVTTAMSLLDLLDRNHRALQELEEKAPGTFNHSMLVGSLAGRAARAVSADPLLAQAAAWYHDLGKTTHPQYFVENQLGYNPHDELEPAESAEIIRAHVVDGLELAKKYRIPDDVANGIRMHHGTSLMRYFYHKALSQDPDVDPALFRHHGVKPEGKEMAIVMISDATEAAARAYAQQEQPTEEGLTKLVDGIVAEKLEDGQFDEASLTFGELTTIKREIVAGLAAYYHARVEYPDFPTAETTVVP